MLTRIIRLSVTLAALAAAAACGKPEPAPAATAPAGKKVDAATAGSISGRIAFAGTLPPPEHISMTSDDACVQSSGPNPLSDAVVVTDGGLANVFVYVKSGLDPEYTFDTPTKVVELDQHGCMYAPRVVGVQVGQPVEIVNNDPTLHNVHALAKVNREFNQGQPSQGMRTRQVFTAPEVMMRVKCDVHSWMTAWVGVVAHPYFTVSQENGAYEIKGLPPGTYTIEAWHEKFGTQTAQVTVAEKQPVVKSFTFSATASGQ